MKLIHRIADAIEVFAPIIILLFVCASYLLYPGSEKSQSEQFKVKMEQGIEKNKAGNVSAPFIPFSD